MDKLFSIQDSIFQQIKSRLPQDHSFVHEIAESLSISYDSAYRRIRGEKALSFEELYTLSTSYGISVDTLFNIQSNNVVFNCMALEAGKFEVKDWLGFILGNVKKIAEAKEKQIIYAAKDIPFFHYFEFPEIAAFKVFFWEKTLFQFPEYEGKRFRMDEADPDVSKIGKQVISVTNHIPTIEIWNQDTFNIMLRQIEFYWIAGFFEKKDDFFNICDKIEKLVRHIWKQAEAGYKFFYGQDAEGLDNTYQFYENEVVLNDNTIMITADGIITTFLTFNVLSLLTTNNPGFCTYVGNYMQGLVKKSNLLSRVGEKDRNRFFNNLIQLIEKLKTKIDA